MTTLRKLMSAAVCAAACGLAATADDKQPGTGSPPAGKADAPTFEGGYTIVSGEEGGKPIPDERIKGSTVRFEGNTVVGVDKDTNQIFTAKFRLDPTTRPCKILMTSTAPKESSTAGLIEKDGDTVRLIYALPGGETPTEFKTKEKQQMFVLKNLNKERRGDANVK